MNTKVRSRLQTIECIDLQENNNMVSFEIQLCQYPHLISQVIRLISFEFEIIIFFYSI